MLRPGSPLFWSLLLYSPLLLSSPPPGGYLWVGGLNDNSIEESANWSPSGPPGTNGVGLFSTADNPNSPTVLASDSYSIALMYFNAPAVHIEVFGELSAGDIQNEPGITTLFNLHSGSSMEVEGTLATDGLSSYSLDNASFLVSATSESNAIFSLQNGSSLTVDYPLTLSALSSLSSTDQVVLNDSLTIGNADNQSIFGSISGTGNLIKQGSGSVSLDGNNSFLGQISVQEGSFAINGFLPLSSSLDVLSGTLKGTGTVGAVHVHPGASVAPGNSIGTLNTGSILFDPGSTFQIEISPSASSLLNVSGTASLDGMLNIIQTSGSYPRSAEYLILQTSGGISGNFDSILLGGIPTDLFHLSQEANNLYLSYTIPALSTSNLSGNALRVANYLNEEADGSTLLLFSGLSDSSLQQAMDSISPARNAFPTYITNQLAFSMSNLLSSHLDDQRILSKHSFLPSEKPFLTADSSDTLSMPLPKEKKEPGWSTWLSGFWEFSHQSASLQNPSFHYTSEAALAGADYRGRHQTLLGTALGYAHSHYQESDGAGHGKTNNYFLSLYASQFLQNFYLSPAIWGVFNEAKNTRVLSFPGFSKHAYSHLFAWQLIPHLEVGHHFQQTWGTIIPFASADWSIFWQRKYSEHGASPFNAQQQSHQSSIFRSETGLKFSESWKKSWGAIFLREKVSYVFENPLNTGTVQSSFAGTPGSFTVTAVQSNLNLGAIGLDLLISIGHKNPTTISLSYDGEFGSNYWDSGVRLIFNKNF